MPANQVKAFNINAFIQEAKKQLTPSQAEALAKLENSVSRGDVQDKQIASYIHIAGFWKDSVRAFEPYAYYISEAAKLDKSEKNLTFAAQIFLDNLRSEQDPAKLNWEATEAIALFEKALELNPGSDDLKIDLASCYVFGKGRVGGTEETMKGIQMLLGIVRKDSGNMKAQMVLGIGDYVSGQYDKAVDRLLKVVNTQPDNFEAIAMLADTYAAKGDKASALKWYEVVKRMTTNPDYLREVDNRIKQLR